MTYTTPRTSLFGIAPALAVGAKLECNPGFDLTFEGEVVAVRPSHYVVEYSEGGRPFYYSVNRTTMRDQEGDLWVRPVPSVTEWFNVYDDLTIGSTAHKSWETAVVASKFGKTRIGIVERTRRGTTVVSSKVHSTTPQRRSAGNTRGVNPYA